jgi:hypothetical protein
LVDEALRVLQSKGKAAFSSTAASPLLAAGGSGGKGSSGEALRARARGSKVLLELLDMTGLEPVKKAMLDLADQVGAACMLMATAFMHAYAHAAYVLGNAVASLCFGLLQTTTLQHVQLQCLA